MVTAEGCKEENARTPKSVAQGNRDRSSLCLAKRSWRTRGAAFLLEHARSQTKTRPSLYQHKILAVFGKERILHTLRSPKTSLVSPISLQARDAGAEYVCIKAASGGIGKTRSHHACPLHVSGNLAFVQNASYL